MSRISNYESSVIIHKLIKMLSALGLCEDPECAQSSSAHETVRLFRCSIHCDRLLCLSHLNAHNIVYEEEKKQADAILQELQSSLTLYQKIFEQHIQSYRELVHQVSTLLLRNASSVTPIEQIRPVLEKLQRAIAMLQHEKVIIKNEAEFDHTENGIEKIDLNLLKDSPKVKKEKTIPTNILSESGPRLVIRLERVQIGKEMISNSEANDEQSSERQSQDPSEKDESSERLKDSTHTINLPPDDLNHQADTSHDLRVRRHTDENEKQNNKRLRVELSVPTEMKQNEKLKKKK